MKNMINLMKEGSYSNCIRKEMKRKTKLETNVIKMSCSLSSLHTCKGMKEEDRVVHIGGQVDSK